MSFFARLDRRFVSWVVARYHLGFSQFGEEKIVGKMLAKMGVTDIYYLDIGANDPIFNNNTYVFYCRGGKGVCVEANPVMTDRIQEYRPRDICLNVGACGEATASTLMFHVSSSSVVSSFSEETAAADGKQSTAIEIPMMPINDILDNICERTPNFVSIDVEGMDEGILRALDFEKHRPEIFCIETRDIQGNRQTSLIELMVERGYRELADTYVNSIFVDTKRWDERPQ